MKPETLTLNWRSLLSCPTLSSEAVWFDSCYTIECVQRGHEWAYRMIQENTGCLLNQNISERSFCGWGLGGVWIF